MRVVLDLQACQATNKNRGIGRYSLRFDLDHCPPQYRLDRDRSC